jgi:hypothetical protein
MSDETQNKVLKLLDVISVEVAATRQDTAANSREIVAMRQETADLRTEMRAGFGRVERRLGHIEVRVETVETELRSFRGEFERRIAPLER